MDVGINVGPDQCRCVGINVCVVCVSMFARLHQCMHVFINVYTSSSMCVYTVVVVVVWWVVVGGGGGGGGGGLL